MDIRDRRILLTGASGGIGAAIAQRLATRGARLLLVARSIEPLQRLRATLPEADRHQCLAVDVTTPEGRARLDIAMPQFGTPFDVLIHCAGMNRFRWLSDSAEDDIEAMLQTNLLAPILVSRIGLRHLRAGGGRILLVGSSFGSLGYPGFAAYCASKFGLRGFSEGLRRELADTGIQVAHLAPRATRTALNSPAVVALNSALGNHCDPPERVAAVVEQMLLARRMRDRAIGWPERLFLRINAVFPALVDAALRRQLPIIRHYARHYDAALPRQSR